MPDVNKVSLKPFFLALLLALTLSGGWVIFHDWVGKGAITTFEDCKKAGNPVMESFPEQCTAGKQTFINSSQLSQ